MLQHRALVDSIRLALTATAATATVIALGACTRQDNSELNWARAALERNPQVKVLATDSAKNTLQVRVKATGETLTLTPGELAAIPIGDLLALTSAPRATLSTPATAKLEPTQPAPVQAPAEPSIPAVEPAAPSKPEYIVKREDGRVRVTGPGVSIETHSPTASASDAPSKRFDEPIVCDGKRMLIVDNKRINVAGDAIVARGGCELHITNSRINASGTGVTVLDATVHIVNSEITGDEGSLTTSSAARVILRNSTFIGLARRDGQVSIQDQGGNSWR